MSRGLLATDAFLDVGVKSPFDEEKRSGKSFDELVFSFYQLSLTQPRKPEKESTINKVRNFIKLTEKQEHSALMTFVLLSPLIDMIFAHGTPRDLEKCRWSCKLMQSEMTRLMELLLESVREKMYFSPNGLFPGFLPTTGAAAAAAATAAAAGGDSSSKSKNPLPAASLTATTPSLTVSKCLHALTQKPSILLMGGVTKVEHVALAGSEVECFMVHRLQVERYANEATAADAVSSYVKHAEALALAAGKEDPGGDGIGLVSHKKNTVYKWSSCTRMLREKYNFCAVWYGGEIFCIGSSDSYGAASRGTAERYDVMSILHDPCSTSLPTRRWELGLLPRLVRDMAVCVLEHDLYLIGGYYQARKKVLITCTDEEGQKAAAAAAAAQQAYDSAVSGKVSMEGGVEEPPNLVWNVKHTFSDEVYIYKENPAELNNGSWVLQKAKLNVGRVSACSCFYRGSIWLAGGYSADGKDLSSVEVYNPVTKRWTLQKGHMVKPRSDFSLFVGDNVLYAVGGGDLNETVLTIERYNREEKSWELITELNEDRFGCAACYMEGFIYVFGGRNDSIYTWNAYNVRTDLWASCAMVEDERFLPRPFMRGQAVVVPPNDFNYY